MDGVSVSDGSLTLTAGGNSAALATPDAFVGYGGDAGAPDFVLLRNNGLHIQIMLDRGTDIGASDPAGISDVRLESAMSTIMDCEDSVAAVDAEDKVVAYGNWLGLMKGDLQETFEKGGQQMTRKMADDIAYTAADGSAARLKGRSLMLVRNVGHLMTNPAILDAEGREISEGLMDAMITTLIAMHDLKNRTACAIRWPDRSMWSNPRCTGRKRSHLPTRFSPASKRFWACLPTRSSWALWTRNAARR